MLRSMEPRRSPNDSGPLPEPSTADESELRECQAEIRAFLRRPYWRRVWVIQEITLRARVTILCGARGEASWEMLDRFLGRISRDGRFRGPELDHTLRLCATRTAKEQGKPIGLLQLLYETAACAATDDRDRVYAVLGLAFNVPQYVSRPRYDWTREAICVDITKTLVRFTRSPDIILAGGKSPDSWVQLPSWCPAYLHWPSTLASKSLSRYLSSQDERYRLGQLTVRWNTTGTSKATRDVAQFLSSGALSLKGIFISSILTLGASVSDSRAVTHRTVSPQIASAEEMEHLRAALGRAITLYRKENDEHLLRFLETRKLIHTLFKLDSDDPLWQTQYHWLETDVSRLSLLRWRGLNQDLLVGGHSLKETALSMKLSFETDGWPETMKDSTVAYAAREMVPLPATALPTNDAMSKIVSAHVLSFEDLVNEGLRLMTTDRNEVGWAHPDARPGDCVFLLAGCSMPAILRPREDGASYTVVGHAYLDGVMDNEVWQAKSNDLQDVVVW